MCTKDRIDYIYPELSIEGRKELAKVSRVSENDIYSHCTRVYFPPQEVDDFPEDVCVSNEDKGNLFDDDCPCPRKTGEMLSCHGNVVPWFRSKQAFVI